MTLFSKRGVIQNGALCHASMGSHGLDTKTTLSVSDITAISPAMLLLFASNSLFLCVTSFSEYTACMRHTLCSLFKMCLSFFWQLTGDKERRQHWILRVREKKHSLQKHHPPQPSLHKLWWIQISPFLTTRERRWRIKSHAPSRVITNYTCRDLILQRSRRTWILCGSLANFPQ